MYKPQTTPRDHRDLSVASALENDYHRVKGTVYKRIRNKIYGKILIKDVFTFAVYPNKATFGISIEKTF